MQYLAHIKKLQDVKKLENLLQNQEKKSVGAGSQKINILAIKDFKIAVINILGNLKKMNRKHKKVKYQKKENSRN